MKKYLVTGGAGFIGSNIVNSLVESGHGVVVLDNESSDAHEYFHYNDKAKYHKVDICEHDKIKHLFKNVDTVFHCAAEARIQPAISVAGSKRKRWLKGCLFIHIFCLWFSESNSKCRNSTR